MSDLIYYTYKNVYSRRLHEILLNVYSIVKTITKKKFDPGGHGIKFEG